MKTGPETRFFNHFYNITVPKVGILSFCSGIRWTAVLEVVQRNPLTTAITSQSIPPFGRFPFSRFCCVDWIAQPNIENVFFSPRGIQLGKKLQWRQAPKRNKNPPRFFTPENPYTREETRIPDGASCWSHKINELVLCERGYTTTATKISNERF